MNLLTPYIPADKQIYESGDAFKIYQEIVKNKKTGANKTCLTNIESDIKTAYKTYEQKIDTKEYPTETSEECYCELADPKDCLKKIALQKCYDPSPKKLDDIKAQIKTLNPIDRCCYCDGLNATNTFDHFLPQDKFPEFSVFVFNLIPCCSQCNSAKSVASGHINFYYDNDVIEDVWKKIPLVTATINFTNPHKKGKKSIPRIEFKLDKPPVDMQVPVGFDRMYTKIKDHYAQVGLLLRLSDGAVSKVLKVIQYINIAKKRVLSDQLTFTEKSDGVNHWEAVLYRCLIANYDQIKEWALLNPN